MNNGVLNSPTATVSITVNPVYLTPMANAQSVSLNQNSSLAITLTGADPNHLPLTYLITVQPQHGRSPRWALVTHGVYLPPDDRVCRNGFVYLRGQ